MVNSRQEYKNFQQQSRIAGSDSLFLLFALRLRRTEIRSCSEHNSTVYFAATA